MTNPCNACGKREGACPTCTAYGRKPPRTVVLELLPVDQFMRMSINNPSRFWWHDTYALDEAE